MRLGIAADHAGFQHREWLIERLRAEGHEVVDFGASRPSPDDDYPDYVLPLARALGAAEIARGIAICGSGVGACIAANKIRGVRASVAHDAYSAAQGVEHDRLNLLCIGARVVPVEQAHGLVRLFLAARFSGEPRHVRRLAKIDAAEESAGVIQTPPAAGRRILAGDVGGTNARFALFELGAQSELRVLDEEVYPSAKFPGLLPIAREFLERLERPPDCARLAVAGPVRAGRVEFTNLDWEVEARELARELGIADLLLLNDFEAVAHAIDRLEPGDLRVIQAGRPQPAGPRILLGAGTGLGTAFAVGESHRWIVASEAGHADFAARTPEERTLLESLARERDHVSWERVVSGSGIGAIYRHLASADPGSESPATRSRLERENPAAVVSELWMKGEDPLCERAMELFCAAYGAQAGNLALLLGGRGQVYLAGGVTLHILKGLRDGPFLRAFRSKGRLSPLLEEIPVYAIAREDAGLLGAASAAVGAN